MQIKATVRYCFIATNQCSYNKKTHNKCWQGCGKIGTLMYSWWEWKTIWFVKKLNIELAYEPR